MFGSPFSRLGLPPKYSQCGSKVPSMGFGKWQTRSKKWSFEVYCSKENAYHREHAVAKKLENENRCPGTLRGLSADSPRASAGLIAHRTSESCIPHFETSILLRKSQGWVTITTINLRVLEKSICWNAYIYNEIDRLLDRKCNNSQVFLKRRFLECLFLQWNVMLALTKVQ